MSAPTRTGPIRVRPLRPDDRASFEGFYERCFDAEYGPALDPESLRIALAWGRSSAVDELLYDDGPGELAVGAFAGDRPVGTLSCTSHDAGVWLAGLYVEPERKGAGIGSALVSHVVDGIPHDAVLALGVFDGSAGAIRFYESIGFERAGHGVEAWFGDAVPMGRWLMLADRETCAARLGVRDGPGR